MRRDDASERQVQAADPAVSTWLSANAGSGKTRVLTDRVARLLMEGTEPQRILCLTYTKAAAAEMQNRLFQRLGTWAMLDEDSLRAALRDLGVEAAPSPETLARARRLFARAIETPGGLKIQTIHSFCAALLRRFPLEAGVSPQFTEMEGRSGEILRADIVEDLADGPHRGVIETLAALYTGENFAGLTEEVARHAEAFARPLDRTAILLRLGLSPALTARDVIARVFPMGRDPVLNEAIAVMETGKATDTGAAAKLRGVNQDAPGLADLELLEGVFLTGASAKAPFTAKIGALPTKDTAQALGPRLDRLHALMRRVEDARALRIGLMAAERSAALHAFAALFVPEYERRKAARGWLDFDDLILRARALLTDPSVAQWVLFRLDGGIDHLLVDEAQDTGPEQWRVIERLAQEFTAGAGARDTTRTIFVVGDKKQSIYSFQGADLRAFDAMQRHFRQQLADIRQPLSELSLDHSFRSSPAILRAVDLTFDERRGRDLGGEVKHIAFHGALPGRVDLWPPLADTPDPDPGDWTDPVDLPRPRHHTVQLAEMVAAEITRLLAEGTQIATPKGQRPLRAGDFLILVQRRSALFQEIIRACKTAGLPIAGADRLRLGAVMAVKDLAALLSFLDTPEDSLSLATALRSPLFGWTEAALYDLAQGREGYLWAALRLRSAEYPHTFAVLADLRDQVDYLRPFELIDRMLTRHDGRRRLLARLGIEAEDGIDQLLAQALAYERAEVPSLTGFLGRLKTDDVEVRRQADAAGDRIRVMTVHGAKGLESPVVILPDTADRNLPDSGEIVTLGDGTPLWKPTRDTSPAEVSEARDAARAMREEENLRLLYVAMTRAESWLIVAAAGKLKRGEAWHDLVGDGLRAAGAVAAGFPTGEGLRLEHGDWPAPIAAVEAQGPVIAPPLPDWALTPPAPPPPADAPLSPSKLGGAKVMPGEAGMGDTEQAKRRGTALHLLLEHLPEHDAADWPAVAAALCGDAEAELLPEALAVLLATHLAHVFAPGTLAEVPVTARVAGRQLVGTIDRLVVKQSRILAIDFKSNAVIPSTPQEVPEGLLRQMAAYRAALSQIWPEREIAMAILWTRGPNLMLLPPALLQAALERLDVPAAGA